ncbi:hypothetical protein [Nitrospirillum viridazoti]|uniref:Carboxymuconolactone decarboxylase-like domain-containing protein n=1 Tax=Nitrospirillum viridazoti CBAmc TaxID=1441467 RepID=A0A248JRY9_9PROT|nr:hypothetical protein [Nitrospirillum amazonense]ASG21465.1 hypothetical protein Y958_12005 [Nitrospirillum amazonense CBAmc]TWB29396.1 AhpD family alkylhydroperoxidase [Nitrospirillum amazonense]
MFYLLMPEAMGMAAEATRLILWLLRRRLARLRFLLRGPVAIGIDVRGTLAKGELPATLRERIALAIAEAHGCDF